MYLALTIVFQLFVFALYFALLGVMWLMMNLRRLPPALFVVLYGAMGTAFVSSFGAKPPPRAGDVFLIGTLIVFHLYSTKWATLLFVYSALVMMYLLPPYGEFRVDHYEDIYRLLSYFVTALVSIRLLKAPRPGDAAGSDFPEDAR